MARRHFSSSRSRGASRATSWLELQPTITALDTSIAAIILSLTTAEKAKRPFTIVRTHIHVRMASDQLGADEQQLGAIGMCVISDQAEAIGITAVPTPVVDLASDLWFLHQFLSSDFSFISAVGFDAAGGYSVDIDSKAMRKVNDDEDVILVAETASVASGALYTIAGRLLIKEH